MMCIHCGNVHKDGVYLGNMNKACSEGHAANIVAVGHCPMCRITITKFESEQK